MNALSGLVSTKMLPLRLASTTGRLISSQFARAFSKESAARPDRPSRPSTSRPSRPLGAPNTVQAREGAPRRASQRRATPNKFGGTRPSGPSGTSRPYKPNAARNAAQDTESQDRQWLLQGSSPQPPHSSKESRNGRTRPRQMNAGRNDAQDRESDGREWLHQGSSQQRPQSSRESRHGRALGLSQPEESTGEWTPPSPPPRPRRPSKSTQAPRAPSPPSPPTPKGPVIKLSRKENDLIAIQNTSGLLSEKEKRILATKEAKRAAYVERMQREYGADWEAVQAAQDRANRLARTGREDGVIKKKKNRWTQQQKDEHKAHKAERRAAKEAKKDKERGGNRKRGAGVGV